jgi:hypothetical protein
MPLLFATQSRRRRTTAAGIEHAVERATQPRWPLTSAVPLEREAIDAQAERLLELAEVLRSDRDLPDYGVAAARRLVTDCRSPLYVDGERLPFVLTRIELALGLWSS